MGLVVCVWVKPWATDVTHTRREDNPILPRAKVKTIVSKDLAQDGSKPGPRMEEWLDTDLAHVGGIILEMSGNTGERTNDERLVFNGTDEAVDAFEQLRVSDSHVEDTTRG